ncbi:MAG: hypothetical protein KZQ82_09220 [Candidatus Thiodiazotropha sp. (ex Lucinoma annulata)]|nr:hypothetical protein [Candidatus Thiodiazotropha sp. (ex Troendleina suluensis)]MCU7884365.1 hypothetical protein [Candidatus Thiodiazotropha sp. (ex Lucinoma annulata)]
MNIAHGFAICKKNDFFVLMENTVMVRRAVFAPVLVLFSLLFAGHVQAALFDRGGGLIYDDYLDVTWLQDFGYVRTSGHNTSGKLNWHDAVNFASTLNYEDTERGVFWEGWRLPRMFNTPHPNDPPSYDPTGLSGELGYMYYVNLGIEPNYSHNANDPLPVPSNYNPFINMEYRGTWSGTISIFSDRAWYTHLHFGSDEASSIFDEQRVWLLRDGDVAPVPIPPAILLMASGLLFLRFYGRKSKST